VNIFISAKQLRDTRRLLIYPSVGLLAGLHEKVTGRFGWSFHGKLTLVQLRNGKILVAIRITIWIQDRIEGFFTTARYGKPPRTHCKKLT